MAKKRAKDDARGLKPREPIAAQLTESLLMAALTMPRAELPQQDALKELVRRRSRRVPVVLKAVVVDPGQPSDLRATAAVELGKRSTPANRKALAEAVRSQDAVVVRRAAEALGRIGRREDLETLSRLRPRRPEVKRSVDFARSLISYRLGLDRYRIPTPPKTSLVAVDPEVAVPIQMRPLSAGELDEMSVALGRALPAIPLSSEGAQRFDCGQNRFIVAFTRQLHRYKSLVPLESKSAVVAVVLKRSQVLGTPFVYEYVLTDPARRGILRLLGVRPSGVVTHYGGVDLGDLAAGARLRTVDTPYSPPLELRLNYAHETRRLTFAEALLQPQRLASQVPERGPRRLIAADRDG